MIPDPEETITSLRDRIADLRQEERRITRSPVPFSDARARVVEGVDRLIGLRDPTNLQAVMSAGMRGAVDFAPGLRREIVSTIAWLLRDDLISAIGNELEAEYEHSQYSSMPEADRLGELIKVREEISLCELREEALIRRAEASGVSVERRIDASPAAILAKLEV